MGSDLIITMMLLIASIFIIITTIYNYSEIEFTGEVKFKGINRKSKIIVFGLIVAFIIILIINLDNSDSINTVWELLILSTVLTNGIQKYIVSTDGIVLPNEYRKFEFYKWEDIIELRGYGNKKIELLLINNEGKKVRRAILFKKKDYNNILQFLNQNI